MNDDSLLFTYQISDKGNFEFLILYNNFTFRNYTVVLRLLYTLKFIKKFLNIKKYKKQEQETKEQSNNLEIS